jgi:hypothetical protein
MANEASAKSAAANVQFIVQRRVQSVLSCIGRCSGEWIGPGVAPEPGVFSFLLPEVEWLA